jgi:hypothetical protein
MLVGFSSRTRFAGFEVVSFSKAIMVLVSRRNRVTVTVRQVQDAPVALAGPWRPNEIIVEPSCNRVQPTPIVGNPAQESRYYGDTEFGPLWPESESFLAIGPLAIGRTKTVLRFALA